MAVLVFDDFDKPDNATSLGTAVTGQVWTQAFGAVGAFGISSNKALFTWDPGDPGVAFAVVETGVLSSTTKVTLVDPTTFTGSFGINVGLILRYLDNSNYWRMTYQRFTGLNRIILQRIILGSPGPTTVLAVTTTLADGDILEANCCGRIFEIIVNDAVLGSYDDSSSPSNYGTKSGIAAGSGTYFATFTKNFEDFTVETRADCPDSTGFQQTFASIYG
jgi:hypothetical protein